MTKVKIIFASVLLISSAIIIEILMNDSNTKLDKGLIGFFSGILFGTGIGLIYPLIFKKRKVNDWLFKLFLFC